MNPEKVIDRDGDVWTRYPNGLYGCRFPQGTSSFEGIRELYGPLAAPDGTQYGAFTPNAPPAEPLSRREALALAREWARNDDGKIHGSLALRYARFLIGGNDRD